MPHLRPLLRNMLQGVFIYDSHSIELKVEMRKD